MRVPSPIATPAKRAYRALVGMPPEDPVREWRGTAADDQPDLRVLHIGDCGVRRMETSHDLLGDPGYPLTAARRLLEDGISLEFSHCFCVSFENLPDIEKLRSRNRLTDDP